MKIYKKIFYIIKPIIPRTAQIFIRRISIKSNLAKYKDVWPILKGSEKKPDNWPGWPDGKKFALILTHDVEHKRGYDQVLKLMKIEKDFGFVSSFNFVPERDYLVEKEVLLTLKSNGFEYGIHGLYHDGKLFSSKEEFFRRAEKINHYINEWNVSGFRAPAMHHNLDWIGALNIEYDLSTFDTDPFEPQPDGVGTIFPFGVENRRHKKFGYIELPYTLPQDFTTFILLRENTSTIWKEKTDWIAKNGGMVLLNVHPDYINFSSLPCSEEEFSIEIYTDFLQYIKDNFDGIFWNATPDTLVQNLKKHLLYQAHS